MNIHKVNYLTGVNRIQKIYVFYGDKANEVEKIFKSEPTNPTIKNIFNDDELNYIQSQQIEVNFSNTMLHKDDTIGTIKAKIMHEMKNTFSIEEMFMFCVKEYTVNMTQIYNILTQNGRYSLTRNRLDYFFMNIVKDVQGQRISITYPDKKIYTLRDLLDLGLDGKKVWINSPLGKKHVIQEKQYPFLCNPFEFHQEDVSIEKLIRNNTYTLNNNLLLNGGKIIHNNIYLCLAQDILLYRDMPSIIHIYYPLLYSHDVRNIDMLDDIRPKLIENSRSKYTPDIFEGVDLLYQINKTSENRLTYVQKGIKEIQIVIRQLYALKIPTDVLFKIYHASQETPFIKYNPGDGQEKMLRLFANKKSVDGRKIPYLSKIKIRNFLKNITPRSHSISIYFEDLNAQCSITEQGDINVSISFSEAIDQTTLDTMLFEKLNPKLEVFQQYLAQHGYTISIYNGLYHNTTDIKDTTYETKLYIKKPVNIDEIQGCVSNIFVIESNNQKDGMMGRYKRVSNFNQMTSMEAFIIEKQKSGLDYRNIVEQLVENYSTITQDEAIDLVGKIASELQVERGVRKNVIDLKSNPGFRTQFTFDAINSEYTITMSNIDDIQYLPIISVYLDSLVQLTQFKSKLGLVPKKIKSVCGKTQIDEQPFEEIVPEMDKSYNERVDSEKEIKDDKDEIQVDIEEDDEEVKDDVSDSPEDALDLFFGADEESDEESDNSDKTQTGGEDTVEENTDSNDEFNNKNTVQNIEGMKLNNPYYFQKRMQEKDPVLIMTEKKGKFKEYSRICHEHVRRQPVILTQSELDKINKKHPGFLKEESDIVKYGSNPDKQYYYICPRYWDLKRNTLVTPEEIKEKGLEDKIIPLKAKTVPAGKYIYEFTNPYDGTNTPYPSLIPDKHPDGHCLPCCFKNWKADSQVERKKRLCLGKEVTTKTRTEKDDYILGPGKFPLNQDKWGYLPTNIQSILKHKQTECVLGKPCVLRHGVEFSKTQSFLACITDALYYVKNDGNVPSIKDMKKVIVSMLTLDIFITLQNGNLITEFFDNDYKVNINQPKYRESRLYARTKNDTKKKAFFEKACNSYEKFIKFILDEEAVIDYTYLWDLISTPHPSLFENGINLVIFKSPYADTTDNLNLICPTNHYTSRSYDPNKPTLLLYNEGDYFEPIYTLIRVFDDSKREIKGIIQLFKESSANLSPEIKYIFELIIKPFYDKMCKPMASMPRVYKAKHPILLDKLIELCIKYKYTIKKQVVDLQGKVTGLFVKQPTADVTGVIPCYPSSINNKYEYDFVVEDYFWKDYKKTTLFLQNVKKDTEGTIPCSPVFKVIEDEVIVGIITETNQFVQLSVPEPISNINDNLKEMRNSNYVVNKNATILKQSDTVITEEKGIDEEREEFVKKIKLETRFYEAFRNTLKVILNTTENNIQREEIENTVTSLGMMYSEKLKKVTTQLQKIVGNMALFVKDYNYNLINEIHTCITNKDDTKCKAQSPLCSVVSNGKCQIILPKINLLNGVDNEKNYFLRTADELIRYKRIQQFMFQPQVYLSFGVVDYDIRDDEMVLLQSMLTDDFFDGIIETSSNSYVSSNTYDTATPSISETYSIEAAV
jgi:hypothetical protein